MSKRYNILNNSIGWFCFLVAAVTYLLTLEPTASFWDCPEFILQAFKLEVGHPPGNPIFMLTARFFANFAFGDVTKVAWMVNAMSALLSAATILLLFWTITHLVRRLVVADDSTEVSPQKMLIIFGSGICGALMYAWSDTFWFSAVEGEVYAFSSFCTALVFWLILKWENRADRPHSDKYLILIAYVIGISIAVHLLNLLCIPAIVLVIYYRRWKKTTALGSCIALVVSFIIVGLILYGLVPGFIEMSQYFEVFCVNTLGMSFNMGVLIYALVLVASFAWCIYNIYTRRSNLLIKTSFFLSVLLSGIFFIGDNLLVPVLLLLALGAYLIWVKKMPVRILNLVATSILVIFIGYSSYALLLIRSSAHTPMNQNSPDNVFSLSSYLNREQYGDRPLFYGETFNSTQPVAEVRTEVNPVTGQTELRPSYLYTDAPSTWMKEVTDDPSKPDAYISLPDLGKRKAVLPDELNMVFPRMYSSQHANSYAGWLGKADAEAIGKPVLTNLYVDQFGEPLTGYSEYIKKPTFVENMQFFFVYQLNHMYWRYFLWNFAGRQNDIAGNGEPTHGNWISGIPFIDNPRLGDQSLLPDDLGKDNPGHNVFFMLPLIIGLIGLIWQASTSQRGVEQFWVVFFLFFMTGIAIVLYLNQTPDQPRERDYAFAGSFYAYAIWVGMGVAGLWRLFVRLFDKSRTVRTAELTGVPVAELPQNQPEYNPQEGTKAYKVSLVSAIVAAVIGIIIPLQVVSQTWDDHDRSGRYTARDFGMNYLNSLDDNAIIFTYGDNDTFPLWYAQEVEGVRTDVKVVNLSYLATDWYINQIRRQSYDAAPVPLKATPEVYSYNRMQYAYVGDDTTLVSVDQALDRLYSKVDFSKEHKVDILNYNNLYIPVDPAKAVEQGRITPSEADYASALHIPLTSSVLYLNQIMSLDMLSSSITQGWNRPVYFAVTVPENHYSYLLPYISQTGLAYEVTPVAHDPENTPINTDKAYKNVVERFQWGGLDKVTEKGQIYLDETVRRMVITNRGFLANLATELAMEGIRAQALLDSVDVEAVKASADTTKIANVDYLLKFKAERTDMAKDILRLHTEKLPEKAMPYTISEISTLIDLNSLLYELTDDNQYLEAAQKLIVNNIERFSQYVVYQQKLSPGIRSRLTYEDRIAARFFYMLVDDYYPLYCGDVAQLKAELSKQKGIIFPVAR